MTEPHWFQVWGYVIVLVKILAVVGISQGTVAYLILVERKIARLGAGPARARTGSGRSA